MQIAKQIRIVGASPLLMHNGQTADPLNPHAKAMKAVTSKRKKTDEDYAELASLEWRAGLYVDERMRLVIKAEMLEACLIEGAKKSKLGKQFKSAVFVERDAELVIPTRYGVAEDLITNPNHRDVRAVRVGTNRVMRCRPIFREWSLTIDVTYDDAQIDESSLTKAIIDAGQQVGIGDYRPRYGRFVVE